MGFLRRGFTIAGLAGLFCAAVLVAGCGSSGSDSTGGGGSESTGSESTGSETSGGEGIAFTPKLKGGIPGALLPNELDLWKYNFDSGKYDVVAGDASKPYQPSIKKFPAGTKLGYIDPWAANPFAIPIREGFEALGKKYGFEVVYCDTAFKPEKAVECAEEVSHQGPEFVVAGNWQVGAATAMMKVLDGAKIPAASVDVSEPNAVFVGTNNYDDGLVAGKAGGEFAKQEWDCDEVWLLLGENLAEGEAADLRLQGFADGFQEVCGGLSDDQIERVRMAAATSDQALTATTDWLTAHPQAKHVLATSLDDERASGIAKSFAQATETEAFALGMGCDTVGIEVVKQAEPTENHFLGCTAFFPEKYPDLLVSVAQATLEEEPVPSEVHVGSQFLDHTNIDQFYSE
jgi:ribose transport system substrate-binding protein